MTSVRDAGKDLRSPGVLAWMRLARVFQRVERDWGEHLRGWDLNVAQFDVLAHVGASEGMTQQELADSLLVTKGNVCQLLDRMEGRGWISRRQEGRANRLFLTGKGRRLFDEVVPRDRKSTRLNSSHANTSYAVFCLKKTTIHNFTLP